MGRPVYESTAPNVLEGYIGFVGQVEGDFGSIAASRDEVEAAGRQIGEACRLITDNNWEGGAVDEAQVMFLGAEKALGRVAKNPSRHDAAMLDVTAGALALRDRPGIVVGCSRLLTLRGSNALEHYMSVLRAAPKGVRIRDGDRWGVALGRVVEIAFINTLARIKDNRVACLTALPHHERKNPQGSPSHFDFTVSFSVPETGTHTQKVSAKAGCVGDCGQTATRGIKRIRRHTNDDIFIASGCCDLGIREMTPNTFDLTVPTLLVREAQGRASRTDVVRLNRVTNGLLAAMVDRGDSRMGQRQAA